MKKKVMNMKLELLKLFAMMIVLVALPAISFCQPPEPVDENPDVPFNKSMNIVYLVIGVLFAGIIVWQEIKNRRRLQGSDIKR